MGGGRDGEQRLGSDGGNGPAGVGGHACVESCAADRRHCGCQRGSTICQHEGVPNFSRVLIQRATVEEGGDLGVAFDMELPGGGKGRAESVGGGLSDRHDVGSGPLDGRITSHGSDDWNSSDSADLKILAGIPPSLPPTPPLASPPSRDHTTADSQRHARLHSGHIDMSKAGRPDLGAACVSAFCGETHRTSRSRHEVVHEPELGAKDDERAHTGCEGVDLVDDPRHPPRARYVTPGKGPTPLQRQNLDFHTIPISCVSYVPEMGLLGVIRSHAASIRTYVAHVFRIKDLKI